MRCKKKPVVTPARGRIGVGVEAWRSACSQSERLQALAAAGRALIAHWGSPRTCKRLVMEAAEWRIELEALQRLLARQQQQIKVLQKQLQKLSNQYLSNLKILFY